ncbi:MAG: amidohydrolase [Clostridiales bacterium]|nr:amidohydrolase [Clostridiales bacterium]
MSVIDDLKTQEVVKIRRIIHQFPELARHEVETAKFVEKYLDELEIPVTTGIAQTGVVGFIEKEFAVQTLLIRANMDALPIAERTNLPFASQRGGVMHACGNDAHTAMLLATAKNLMARRDELKSNVKLVFQPGEEDTGGALSMIEAGVLSNNVTGAIALNVNPDAQTGSIILRKGSKIAANDRFEIKLKGAGGHGANPTQNSSISYVCAQIVENLYSIATRRFETTDNALVSVCNIECGNTYNVMPSTATIRGTIRTYSDGVRDLAPVYIEQIVGCMAAAYDIEYEIRHLKGNPPVINDAAMVDKAGEAAEGIANVEWSGRPGIISDDFAYFAQKVPSCYVDLGCANAAKGIIHPIHSEFFDIDESCMKIGADFLTNFALKY